MIGTHTYESESGTEHILDSDPEQKTLEYPDTSEFHAVALCGHEMWLREGDLSKQAQTVTYREGNALCAKCALSAGLLVVDDPDGDLAETKAGMLAGFQG